jgi:hypothetical protein
LACPDLDDDFEDAATLECWTQLGAASVTATIENGQMVLEAAAMTQWVDDQEAALLYKEITGNFLLETSVQVHDGSEGATMPSWRLGGLLARDPDDGGGENHVGWFMGSGDTDQSHTFLYQNTVDGTSEDGNLGSPSGSIPWQLRMCRVGDDVILVRMTGTGWQEWNTYARPDLPATLQVGMTAFSNNASVDLVVEFDEVVFTVPSSSADCTAME